MRMPSVWLGLGFVALVACGLPSLPKLGDGTGDDDGVSVGYGLELLAGDIGGPGNVDGTQDARFNNPFDVAIDSAGNAYIADLSNSTIRKVTAGGVVTTLAGVAGLS